MLDDARIYQIGFLACFLLLGVSTRDWTIHPNNVAIAIGTCLITQSVVSILPLIAHSQPGTPASQIPNPNSSSVAAHSAIQNLKSKIQNLKSLLSALITALGLSLLLRVDHPGTMVLAAGLAILSKF
ncbi:MAG TPA: Na+-transporting NADH:ubiquinone oxidoreductase, subunit NqrB, partial [Allocoleopsis sp.]